MFKKILIANRGEIAVRIIRACREMGILTVAVCSEADVEALHSQLADETVCIGPMKASQSYLNMERIIGAALATGADAIHPGFGFLSENSKFARMCEKCNLTFIGPKPDVMDQMGNKSAARRLMIKAGVPVVPGTELAVKDAEVAKEKADEMGYPVIVKAALGGGGKGMRIVQKEEEFISLFETAKREAKGAFSDESMYIEKYIHPARHVEFQILADQFGNVIHLGERECSIQRRHQKMVEESPCCSISEKLREKMGRDAVKAAKAANYTTAGTIEFIVDPNQNYYFIEMNTRIQVEHGVTELVTGLDLIKEQIKLANGEALQYRQEDIQLSGHVIECRINAEDPDNQFLPSPGTVENLHVPGGNGVRIDSALFVGYKVPPLYDSLLMKVMVKGQTRKEAIAKMKSVLGELVIEGMKTNIDFQYRILENDDYMNDRIHTGFIESMMR